MLRVNFPVLQYMSHSILSINAYNYRYKITYYMLNPYHQNTHLIIRNTQFEDIPKIVNLQKESFLYLARYDNVWHPQELASHPNIFPQRQFVAVEPEGTIVGSASTLIVSLYPEFADHTWKEITANGMFTNHNS